MHAQFGIIRFSILDKRIERMKNVELKGALHSTLLIHSIYLYNLHSCYFIIFIIFSACFIYRFYYFWLCNLCI